MLVVLCAFALAGIVAAAPAPDAGPGYSESDLLPAVFDTVKQKYTGFPEQVDSSSKFNSGQYNEDQFQSFGSQFDHPGSNRFAATSPNSGFSQDFGRSPPTPGFQSATSFNTPQPIFQNNFAQSSPNFQSPKNFQPSQDFQTSQNFQASQNFRTSQNFQPSQNFRTSQNFQPSQKSPSTATRRPFISIVTRDQHTDPNGQYTLSTRDSAGTSTYEEAKLRPSSLKEGGMVLARSGGYSYTSPEGYLINLSYTADENGFHPSGSA